MFRKLVPAGLTALPAAIGAVLFVLHLGAQFHRLGLYLHHGIGFHDPDCASNYCDLTMFWLAGHLASHGMIAAVYDHARSAAAIAAFYPYKNGYWPFVYPPPMLLPAAALSLVPLMAGYYTYCTLSIGLSAWLLRRAGLPWWCIALGLCSPAAMWNLYLGQMGLLCGVILFAGLAGMPRRPIRSGVLLAMLCVKPQYALLAPVAVLARQHWRVMAAGMLSLAAILVVTLWLYGFSTWAAFLGPGQRAVATMLDQPARVQIMGSSVFWMARELHASLGFSYAVQAFVSACCMAAAWFLWRRPGPPPVAATCLLTVLASPYGYTYDLAIYSVLLPCLARRGAPWRNAALAWLWLAPAFVPRVLLATGVLVTPLLLMAALALAWRTTGLPAADTRWPAPRAGRPRPAPAE